MSIQEAMISISIRRTALSVPAGRQGKAGLIVVVVIALLISGVTYLGGRASERVHDEIESAHASFDAGNREEALDVYAALLDDGRLITNIDPLLLGRLVDHAGPELREWDSDIASRARRAVLLGEKESVLLTCETEEGRAFLADRAAWNECRRPAVFALENDMNRRLTHKTSFISGPSLRDPGKRALYGDWGSINEPGLFLGTAAFCGHAVFESFGDEEINELVFVTNRRRALPSVLVLRGEALAAIAANFEETDVLSESKIREHELEEIGYGDLPQVVSEWADSRFYGASLVDQ
jgi:hypothetical protein